MGGIKAWPGEDAAAGVGLRRSLERGVPAFGGPAGVVRVTVAAGAGRYGDRVAKDTSVISAVAAWRRRAVSRVAHRADRWMRQAATVSAERPGPYRFARIGAGTKLAYPQGTIFGEPWIEIGECCIIAEQVTLTVGLMPGQLFGPEPLLTLGNGVVLGRGSHVIASRPVVIGDNVYCGPGVYITSDNHSYDDPDEPIGRQWPRSAPVEIGAGSWLGVGAIVLPGARLGRNVAVAAGSVVRGEVPDRVLVAGSPAKVVRRWDPRDGWQPPLRTPAPRPLPDGVTADGLAALRAWEAAGGAAEAEAGSEASGGSGVRSPAR
jgi:acetyltransferase-like isoleucine patch superfamily enzyme